MIFPPAQDRGVVVFLVWNSLSLGRRLTLSAALLLVGLGVQAATLLFLPGLPFLLLSNLLLLVRGYNNRVDLGKFDPSAQWERVEMEKLDQLIALDRRIARWDRSALDVTNGLGILTLLLLLAPLGYAIVVTSGSLQILLLDLLVLLLPHWFTGTRSVMRQPNLMLKADIIRDLRSQAGSLLKDHQVQLLMLLKGEQRVPADLKLKIEIHEHPAEFLGLYGQVVLNRVQGKAFPYFYVVLVTQPNAGLRELSASYHAPAKLVTEFKVQQGVEVLVIRQETTKTSGYHTTLPTMLQLLGEGVRLSEQLTAACGK